MKLINKLNPKTLFQRSRKNRSPSVSRSFGSSSSSSDNGSASSSSVNLKCSSTTPTSVLPQNSPFLQSKPGSLEITSADADEDWSGFSSDTHFELVQAFKLIDKDGDGKITRTELRTVLERVGAEPPTEEELVIMFQEVDRDGDGCISLEEFSAIGSCFEGPACGSELRDAFDFFDADRDGKISEEELLGVFMSIGDDQCTLEDCRRMIGSVDSDGDGFVCFEDFSKMMERQR